MIDGTPTFWAQSPAETGAGPYAMSVMPAEAMLPGDIIAENRRRALHFANRVGFDTLLLHTNEREDGVHVTSLLERPLDPLNRSLLNQLYESMGADLSEMQVRETRAYGDYRSETTVPTPSGVTFTEFFTGGHHKGGGSFRVTAHSPLAEAEALARPEVPQSRMKGIGKKLLGLFSRDR